MVHGLRSWAVHVCAAAVVFLLGAALPARAQSAPEPGPGMPGFPHGELQRVRDFEAMCSKGGFTEGSDEQCRQAISMALGKAPIIEETRLPGGGYTHVSKFMPPDVGKVGWLGEESCDHAHGQSCMLYVALLAKGDTVPQEVVQARALMQFACHNKYLLACRNLENDGITILMSAPRPRRVDWAKKPADEPLSADVPADLLENMKLPPPATDPVIALMQQQAQKRGPVPMDQPINRDDETESEMVSACLQGAAQQCDSLGRGYASGIGLLRDEARAKYYSEKACQGGQPAACGRVGMAMPQGARDALARRRGGSLLVLAAIAAVILASVCGIAIMAFRRTSGSGSGSGSRSAARHPAPRPVAVPPAPGAVRPSPRG
jgi:TPR repeat protein